MRVPEVLIFSGITDTEGKLWVDFGGREFTLGLDYEICVEKFSFEAALMFNIVSGRYRVTWRKGRDSRTITLNPVFVKDVLDLFVRQLDFMEVKYESSRVEIDFKGGNIVFPTPLSRCLKLCDKDGKQLRFHAALNPGYIPMEGDAESYELDGSRARQKLVLPIDLKENVWNEVSKNSFQAVYMYSDLVITEIVGGFRVPNLGIYTFQEERAVNTFEDPAPLWRRISRRSVTRCFVQILDSIVSFFKNVKASIQCRLRRRNPR